MDKQQLQKSIKLTITLDRLQNLDVDLSVGRVRAYENLVAIGDYWLLPANIFFVLPLCVSHFLKFFDFLFSHSYR